jgi:8-oxo-dGTP pyrophosphatase MutT (NUDIX family)
MADIGIEQKDVYFVAVKVFLERGDDFLVFKDKFCDWDLPGGRIKKHEFETDLTEVIERKMREELGEDIEYDLINRPEILMRHERVEASPGNPTVRIFGIGYRAKLKSGEPKPSEAHVEMKWVNIHDYNPDEDFTGGWLKGVHDYLKTKRTN